jgi:hypothetical protein
VIWATEVSFAPMTLGMLATRVSLKKKNMRFEPKQTETRAVLVVFRFLFRETQIKKFGFVLVCFRVSNPYETTETNRTVSNKPKQTETTLNFLKNTKICSLSNCFSWSSVCFSLIKNQTLCFGIEPKQP